jgi:Ribbon-helix-helix protein, copG family
MSDSPEAGNGKTRKRATAKPSTGQGAARVKATIHISVEADERLSIHAIKMGMDRSELVESLIQRHLRRWVVSDRGEPDGAAGGDAA